MDGGTVWNTNIQQAIDRCTEIVGHNDAKMTIDIVICSTPDSLKEWKKDKNRSAKSYFMRSSKIGRSYVGSDVISSTKRAHPDINWRHLITLSSSDRAEAFDELDFTNKTSVPLIKAGKADAKKAIDSLKKK